MMFTYNAYIRVEGNTIIIQTDYKRLFDKIKDALGNYALPASKYGSIKESVCIPVYDDNNNLVCSFYFDYVKSR